MGNPGEYRKCGIRVSIVKARIRASIGEGKIRVSTGKGRIRASTENVGSRQVLEIGNLSEYRKWGIRVSTGKVESERVSEKVKSG